MPPSHFLNKVETKNIVTPLKFIKNSENKSKNKTTSKYSVKDRRLKQIKSLGKAYLKDYTEFNYKIDTILNEGYTFVKNAKSPLIPLSRIKKVEAKDFISKLL